MPRQAELAEVTVNGRTYRDWTSVRVEQSTLNAVTTATLTVSERLDAKTTFANQQLKPGDSASVVLAGQQKITGKVTQRQASYDANSHAVLIVVRSNTIESVLSQVPLKGAEWRGYGLRQIAEKVVKPLGLRIIVKNPSKDFDKPFKVVNVNPGETVYELVDRLARHRGMFVHDDEQGNLVLASGTDGGGDDLIEGGNILAASCLIQNESEFLKYEMNQQQWGDDQTDDEKARKPAATVDGSASNNRYRLLPAEQPGDATDMKHRLEHERNVMLAATINARITVQGWLQRSGSLWALRKTLSVNSPMLLLKHEPLAVQTLLFSQDNNSGTTTTMTLVRPEALGSIEPPNRSAPGNDAGLPGGTPGNVTALG